MVDKIVTINTIDQHKVVKDFGRSSRHTDKEVIQEWLEERDLICNQRLLIVGKTLYECNSYDAIASRWEDKILLKFNSEIYYDLVTSGIKKDIIYCPSVSSVYSFGGHEKNVSMFIEEMKKETVPYYRHIDWLILALRKYTECFKLDVSSVLLRGGPGILLRLAHRNPSRKFGPFTEALKAHYL